MLRLIQIESRIAIVVLFAVLMITSVRAQAIFTINTGQFAAYSLELNNQFYEFNQSSHTVHNLPAGVSVLRLHQWIHTGFGNQGHWQLIHSGSVNILPMHQTIMTVNSWSGVNIQYIPLMVGPPQPHPGGGFPSGGFFNGMDPLAFDQFLFQLDQIAFDSRKLELAQFAISQSGISVAQLKMVLRKFTFDSNRLTLAKTVYHYTTDRHNYWMLSDAFTFQSNFRELMNSL